MADPVANTKTVPEGNTNNVPAGNTNIVTAVNDPKINPPGESSLIVAQQDPANIPSKPVEENPKGILSIF